MSLLSIRLYPDPVLRVRCPEVETFDAELERLVEDMVETMYAAPGVGLAAPQVGVESRVAVVDATVGEEPGALRVLINPEILSTQGSEVDVEGCLSIPDITDKVERPAAVSVRAFDPQGREQLIEAEGLEARAIQHEIDHLNGILFTDHLNGLRKERARRRLRRLRDEVTELAS
jgi:peptide deformylase